MLPKLSIKYFRQLEHVVVYLFKMKTWTDSGGKCTMHLSYKESPPTLAYKAIIDLGGFIEVLTEELEEQLVLIELNNGDVLKIHSK